MVYLLKGVQTPRNAKAGTQQRSGNEYVTDQGSARHITFLPPPPMCRDDKGGFLRGKLRALLGTFGVVLLGIGNTNAQQLTPVQCYQQLKARFSNIKVVSNKTYWASNNIPTIHPSTDSIIRNFGNDTIINQAYFFDASTVLVDSSVTFINCPRLFFTSGTKVSIPARTPVGYRFEAHKSNLSGACETMWDGIEGLGSTTSMVFIDDTIQGMVGGVRSLSGATLTCVNNQFINNDYSIVLNSSTRGGVWHTIERNTFKTLSTGLYYPFQGQIGALGIDIQNCANVAIGNELVDTSGNYFENLTTGINYNQTSTGTSSVKVAHCRFRKIKGQTASSQYADIKGACIHVSTIDSNNLSFKCFGNNDLTSSRFADADKGIVSNGGNFVTVSNVRLDSVTLGISGNKMGGRYTIENNVLDSIYIGVMIGNVPGANSKINNNFIRTRPLNGTTFQLRAYLGTDTLFVPEGIVIEYPPASTTMSNLWYITNNTINVVSRKGHGINLFAITGGLQVSNNTIRLLPQGNYSTSLMHAGIYCQAGDQNTDISYNSITGNSKTYKRYVSIVDTPKTYGGAGEPTGIHLTSSPAQVRCNFIDSMRNCMQVRGNCGFGAATDPNLRVQGNIFKTAGIGMLFRPTYSPSTTNYFNNFLGRYIGSATMDNNNQFTGANNSYDDYGNGPVKIWVADTSSCIPNFRTIYTSALTALESQGTIANCRYQVAGNIANQYVCSQPFNQSGSGNRGMAQALFPVPLDVITDAENIARGNYVADSNQPASRWINARFLYEGLRNAPLMLPQSATLDSFYNANVGGPFDQIREAEEALSLLSDTLLHYDLSLRGDVLQEAAQKIAAISPMNVFEENEKDMLQLMFTNETSGSFSFTSADQQLIHALASNCRYVVGTAVDKARFLYQTYHVRCYFNDDDQCALENLQHVNGQGTIRTMTTTTSVCKVYPNPVADRLNLEYVVDRPAENVSFQLWNMTGSMVAQQDLTADGKTAAVDVSLLPEGIYHYRLIADGTKQASGKITIRH